MAVFISYSSRQIYYSEILEVRRNTQSLLQTADYQAMLKTLFSTTK